MLLDLRKVVWSSYKKIFPTTPEILPNPIAVRMNLYQVRIVLITGLFGDVQQPQVFDSNINESMWLNRFSYNTFLKHFIQHHLALNNSHWLGLTQQYKQMLHLKGTENNKFWVLLKCQKSVQTMLMCHVGKETAQRNNVCSVDIHSLHGFLTHKSLSPLPYQEHSLEVVTLQTFYDTSETLKLSFKGNLLHHVCTSCQSPANAVKGNTQFSRLQFSTRCLACVRYNPARW